MPHNIYLHSALVLSRKINMKNKNEIKEACIYNNIESAISLALSFFISTFVIATFAVYVASYDSYDAFKDVYPDGLDLSSAADALKTTFGNSAPYIWAVGLLAAGQSSTMTGTYAGQFVMEGFVNIQLPVWQRVLITRSIAIVPALCVTLLSDTTLTSMDTYLNILQSVQLPFALIPLIKFGCDERIMKEFALPKCQTYFASAFGFMLFVFNFVVVFQDPGSTFSDPVTCVLVIVVGLFYLGFIGISIVAPVSDLKKLTKEELEDLE